MDSASPWIPGGFDRRDRLLNVTRADSWLAAARRFRMLLPGHQKRVLLPHMNLKSARWAQALVCLAVSMSSAMAATPPATAYGTSYQVDVNQAGLNIVGDAANEPSLCVDPTNPNRMAVGWRQFDNVTSDFRQAGWAYTTNAGLNWTMGGTLETNVFRSDPVLAADADGQFYYLSLMPTPDYHCDLWRSNDGGRSWQRLGDAYGGDKEWMTIDTTSGPGHGNIYEAWSRYFPASNNILTRSTDAGSSWMSPIPVPALPYWGTLDVGPNGELYMVGTIQPDLWFIRSTNAWDKTVMPIFDLATPINLGGSLIFGVSPINPGGLLGQLWVAADRSTGPTRGNVYVLASVTSPNSGADVMLIRSTDGGVTWSAPQRINDDAPNPNAWHWFGTLSVAPNGRVDACWNDTRNSSDASTSQLYYSWSTDGGVTWAPNRPLSPSFDQSLGYPMQEKIGDYIGMVSLNEGACIAYSATFNGEEDVYYVRAELPIVATVEGRSDGVAISWNSVPGGSYCVQYKDALDAPWSGNDVIGCVVSAASTTSVVDHSLRTDARYYRVVRGQ
jgi:hypothetical protein